MRDVLSYVGLFFVGIFFALIMLLPMFIVVILGERYSCNKQLEAQQVQGEWGLWTDCMVRTNGDKLVPLKYYNIQESIKRGTNQ